MNENPLSVLLISPDPEVYGGVSGFIELLKARMSCKAASFFVGRIHTKKENTFIIMKRLLGAPFTLAKQVRSQHFDVVHINPSFNCKSLVRDGLLLFALRMIGFRRVLVYFHSWHPALEARISTIPGFRQLLGWVLNGTGYIMVLAPAFKQYLESAGVQADRILITRTMFDGDSIQSGNEDAQHPRRRSILFMSRFVREKGIYELLHAFARIATEFPDVDLIMAGDGRESAPLQEQAEALNLRNRITFPGYVGGEAKFALLRNCTIFALPTYFPEGMPVALLEAMGAGKPLLTAQAGGIQHIISTPDNGIILDNVNSETVETGLRTLLDDPEYCRKTGQHNAVYAWQHFEAKAVTAEIEQLYRKIACH